MRTVPASDKTSVQVGERILAITNLGKILYPQTGFTKGEVLDYYSRVAPVLLPHLEGRPLTRKRYPSGVDGPSFFEKNAPRGTPEWVRTVTLPVPGSTMNRETIEEHTGDGTRITANVPQRVANEPAPYAVVAASAD